MCACKNFSFRNSLTVSQSGFLEKVKSGNAKVAGSGFGGKGLDRLDKERDAKEKAERKAYGEPTGEEEKVTVSEEANVKATAAAGDDMTFGNFKVEIRRGPAPDTSKGIFGMGSAIAAARKLAHEKDDERLKSQMKAAEEAAARAGKDTAAHKQALSVVAKLNAQQRASKLVLQSQLQADEMGLTTRKTNPDSTDFHAIIPINDYPQKARWRVTNKETMVQLIDMTGASVTNKGEAFYFIYFFCSSNLTLVQGIYYEPGKEPPSDGPPKLHLLIESNEEIRVRKRVFLIFQDRIHQSFFIHRLSKQCGRSRGCSLKPLLRPCKLKCGIPLVQWVDILCCSLIVFLYIVK